MDAQRISVLRHYTLVPGRLACRQGQTCTCVSCVHGSATNDQRARVQRRGALDNTGRNVLVPNSIYIFGRKRVNTIRARRNRGAVGGTETLEGSREQESKSVEDLGKHVGEFGDGFTRLM